MEQKTGALIIIILIVLAGAIYFIYDSNKATSEQEDLPAPELTTNPSQSTTSILAGVAQQVCACTCVAEGCEEAFELKFSGRSAHWCGNTYNDKNCLCDTGDGKIPGKLQKCSGPYYSQ